MSPENAGNVITANLMNRQDEFAEICESRAGRGLYPGLDTVCITSLYNFIYIYLRRFLFT
jgi:hypothetical protein